MTAELLAAEGAVAAVAISMVALFAQYRGVRRSYLRLGMEARVLPGNQVIVTLQVANDMTTTKWINPAFVLTGPELEDPVDTFNHLTHGRAPTRACCAIDFENIQLHLRSVASVSGTRNRRLLQLPFLTQENDSIGNEVLSFDVSTSLADSPTESMVAIRFYVYGHRQRGSRIHRKTHRLLQLPATAIGGECPSVEEPAVPRAACKSLGGCRKSGDWRT